MTEIETDDTRLKLRDLYPPPPTHTQEVLEPQVVLLLAWALGHVVKDVQTAEYLAGVLGEGIPPYMLATLISVSRSREFCLSRSSTLKSKVFTPCTVISQWHRLQWL